jgi:hypothetical protein
MPKASPDQEITLYILSIVQYLEEQPTDPLQPVGYMPVFRSEEAARQFDGGTGADIWDWVVSRSPVN